jgi:hypothetical protein
MGNTRIVDPDIDFSKGGKALISEMSDRVIIRNISCCASKPVRRE